MDKVERIKNSILGKEVDKIAYSFWTHLPGIDLDPDNLADATYNFYKEYDLDFIKTMNNGMYAIEDFGCKIDYSEIEKGGVAKLVDTPIKTESDWKKIKYVEPNIGALKRELKSLNKLVNYVKGEAPIVFTIFSPITIAEKLSKGMIYKHIESGEKDIIHSALSEITKTTISLVKEVVNLGVDGIFFATQISSYDKCDENIYTEFGVPYDMKVLEAAKSLWFNIIHAHGNNIMFDLLKDYPVDVFNWHAWETLPDIDQAKDMTNKCLMGGLKRMDITNGNRNEITNQIYKTLQATDKKKIILTPGCVIRYPLNKEMLEYVRKQKNVVEKLL